AVAIRAHLEPFSLQRHAQGSENVPLVVDESDRALLIHESGPRRPGLRPMPPLWLQRVRNVASDDAITQGDVNLSSDVGQPRPQGKRVDLWKPPRSEGRW